ncbi:MAG TPA: nucleoside phosphorylase [Clostridia bacterium]|nr:nucleoside phosphorylase [Clostridia bacterium]
MRKEYPILEYDENSCAMIDPQKNISRIDIPENAVICFFNDVIEKYKNEGKLRHVTDIRSEMGLHPIYEMDYSRKRIAVFHPGIGAPLAAGMLEEVIAMGSKKFIACGGAGVLEKELAVGHIVVPVAAVRDEGTSYHYLAPGREVEPSAEGVEAIERALKNHGCKYLLSKTWTTDAFYRETVDKVRLRKSEGCITVEMECSAFCAVAKYRNVIFAQLLYCGDDLSCDEWDSRCWNDRKEIRENVFLLAVEASAGL